MKQNWTRLSKRMLFMYCMLGGLIFLFCPPRITGKLQLAYARLFTWPLAKGRSLTLISRPAAAPKDSDITDYKDLHTENRRLKNDLANMKAQLQEARGEIDRLARVRTVPEWESMQFLPATIVTSTGRSRTELIINRGQDEGVTEGCYVMGAADHSIIGKVSNVSPHVAKVKLITDPTSVIPVEIGDSGVQGLMEGNKIRLVPAKHAIRPGDPVKARKMPGFLDVGVITAEVAQCKPADDPLLLDITIQPVSDITNLMRVFVVTSSQ